MDTIVSERLDVARLRPGDDAAIDEVVALERASLALEAPWDPGPTRHRVACRLRQGWDGEAPEAFVVRLDGRLVATGAIWRSDYDNADLADLEILVAVDQRRRGIGSAVLDHLAGRAEATGRTKLIIGGWDSPGVTGFAAAHAFRPGLREVQRRQVWSDLDWQQVTAHHARAAHAALDYELVRIDGRSPKELLPGLAELTRTINDAPMDDLEIEDEEFPETRIRGYEHAVSEWGRLWRVIARHRGTGELAGHTVVAVEHERPWLGEQHDTAVARGHRGHRLGLLLKAELMVWLREEHQDLRWVDTWNAKSNTHMIEVNEALGYRPTGEAAVFQRDGSPSTQPEA